MEAFIDFSEDELIEDGVLTQGMCARLFSVEEPSPLGFKSGEEEGVGGSEVLCEEKSYLTFLFASSADRRVLLLLSRDNSKPSNYPKSSFL